jgi:hypothetical protein
VGLSNNPTPPASSVLYKLAINSCWMLYGVYGKAGNSVLLAVEQLQVTLFQKREWLQQLQGELLLV